MLSVLGNEVIPLKTQSKYLSCEKTINYFAFTDPVLPFTESGFHSESHQVELTIY